MFTQDDVEKYAVTSINFNIMDVVILMARRLNESQLVRFIGEINKIDDKKYYLLFMIGYELLLKVKELVSLRVIDVYDFNHDKAREYITVKRCGRYRSMIVPESLRRMIEKYVQNTKKTNKDFLFSSIHTDRVTGLKKHISRDHVLRIFKNCLGNIGLNCSMGILGVTKKSSLGLLYDKNKDIHEIAKYLGHNNQQSIKRFLQIQ